MQMMMKEVIDFLVRLERNNNREWFNSHKEEYRKAQDRFDAFTEKLIAGIASFDSRIKDLSAKDCTYRIYRDTRFSQDKSPYKLHIGAFICPGGKKSGYAGYYLQVGPEENGYPCGNMLAAGHYMLEPGVIRILREDISNGEGDFEQTLRQASAMFRLEDEDKMKRVPRGYSPDAPYAEYLKYRTYCLAASPGKAYMLREDMLEQAIEAFRSTHPFIEYLNRAVEYTHEISANRL